MNRDPRVQFWDDERSIGNSLIVTLVPGFAFEPHPDENIAQHVEGFDNIRAAIRAVRKSLRCSCARCKGGSQ